MTFSNELDIISYMEKARTLLEIMPSKAVPGKKVLPWVKARKKINPSRPFYPPVIMPEQLSGYIKARKYDFL